MGISDFVPGHVNAWQWPAERSPLSDAPAKLWCDWAGLKVNTQSQIKTSSTKVDREPRGGSDDRQRRPLIPGITVFRYLSFILSLRLFCIDWDAAHEIPSQTCISIWLPACLCGRISGAGMWMERYECRSIDKRNLGEISPCRPPITFCNRFIDWKW